MTRSIFSVKGISALLIAAMLSVFLMTGCKGQGGNVNVQPVPGSSSPVGNSNTSPVAVITNPVVTADKQAALIHSAAVQGERLIDIITALEKSKRVLVNAGKITPAVDLKMTTVLQKANKSIVTFAKEAKAYSGNDPAKVASIINLARTALASARELNDAEVFGIKDPTARNAVSTILADFVKGVDVADGIISVFN